MFITLEGTEGSGKTTVAKSLKKYFEIKGKKVLLTREPGGTTLGTEIRKILLNPGNKGMNYKTELLLYAADRADHFSNVIIPALKDGYVVISDRCFDSTTAFQGFGRELPLKEVEALNDLVVAVEPDITFWLDIDIEKGLGRAIGDIGTVRYESESRFEKEDVDFHQRVRNGYQYAYEKASGRIVWIDASQIIDDVMYDIINVIEKR